MTKNKKVSLIDSFSVHNFKVSVELLKSYIVCDAAENSIRSCTLVKVDDWPDLKKRNC